MINFKIIIIMKLTKLQLNFLFFDITKKKTKPNIFHKKNIIINFTEQII